MPLWNTPARPIRFPALFVTWSLTFLAPLLLSGNRALWPAFPFAFASTNALGAEPAPALDAKPAPLRPHPDALPNIHKPGEVDIPANVPFIVANPAKLPGIVVDETEAKLVEAWQYSTHTPPYVGLGYLHDLKEGKGTKSVTFTPNLPRAGLYEVRLAHCYNVRRATNTPVTIHHAEGDVTLRINQQDTPPHARLFRTLGTYRFAAGRSGWVRISTEGTDGKNVIADAIQWLPVDPKS